MDSIQSIQKNQLRQTATFICDGWSEEELNLLVSHRLNYTSKNQTSNMLLPWSNLKSLSSKRDLLIQSITEDLFDLENDTNQKNNKNNSLTNGGGDISLFHSSSVSTPYQSLGITYLTKISLTSY